ATSFRVSASAARARASAISYGLGSTTNSKSPAWTCWLSRTRNSTMCPLTCGAMPTKFARTVASSVCGRVVHCIKVTTTAIAAPATMRPPIRRPARRRAPSFARALCGSISLDPEPRHPEHQGDEQREARIDERPRAAGGIDADAKKDRSRDGSAHDADRRAKHPGGEERADHVDLWSHGLPPIDPEPELRRYSMPVSPRIVAAGPS